MSTAAASADRSAPSAPSSPSAGRLRGWAPATRETRDTWFMLALILWTVLPHLLRISPWIALLCLGVLVWRAGLARRQAALPGRWSLILVLTLAGALTWLSERTLLGKDAGVTLLVVLMSLKTLELRARRDALVVFFLGFFLILTQFLYSQTLLTGLGMLVAVWGWLTALTLAHMPHGWPTLAQASWRAARATLYGTPAMVLLFVLFPRISPLWSLPQSAARTGLSDRVALGEVADLATDDRIAMRVRFEGRVPPPGERYFRGPVLTRYDGREWQAEPWLPHAGGTAGPRPGSPPAYRYEATLEPLQIRWLPLLDHALAPPQADHLAERLVVPQDDTLQWRLTHPLGERLRIEAQAWAARPTAPRLPDAVRGELTRLPFGVHPRTREWARALRRSPGLRSASSGDFVQAVLAHIRRERFVYTLSPGLPAPEADAVDDFWLRGRQGFCEHYATALAVILRSVDIPVRVVIGYQGTDPLPVDGFHIVRQSNAHAWVEYWEDGTGWVRSDPTGAVAPERILQSRSLRPPQGLVGETIELVSPGLQQWARQWAELMDNRWNQWVLGYGRQQQTSLLDLWGLDSRDWTSMLRTVATGLGGLALLVSAWAWWDGRRQTPWQRLHAQVRRRLAEVGVVVAPHQGPGHWREALREAHGEAAAPVLELILQLERLRYAPGPQPAWRSGPWLRAFTAALTPLRTRAREARLDNPAHA